MINDLLEGAAQRDDLFTKTGKLGWTSGLVRRRSGMTALLKEGIALRKGRARNDSRPGLFAPAQSDRNSSYKNPIYKFGSE